MNFRENPFYILNLGCDAGRREINAAAEEFAFFAESDEIEKAQSELLNPTRRLKAEMDWFPRGKQEQLRSAIERGTRIEAPWATGLTKLNIDCYNFPLKTGGKVITSLVLREEILRLDRSFADAGTDEIYEELNAARSQAGMPQISENDISAQMLRKHAEVRQMIAETLQNLPEKDYIALVMELAEDLLKQSFQGGVVEDVVDQYEVRMHDRIRQDGEAILKKIEEIKGISTKSLISTRVDALLDDVEAWDLLAQPIQLKCQASGMKHELSEELGRELQQLAVYLHNEKDATEISESLVRRLRPIFAELPELSALLENDEETLSNMIDRSELQRLAGKLSNDTRSQLQEDVWLLREKASALNAKILGLNKTDNEEKTRLRVNVCSIVRDAAIKLHNERTETEFAVELYRALRNNFSDIADLSNPLSKELQTLEGLVSVAPLARRQKYGINMPALPLKAPSPSLRMTNKGNEMPSGQTKQTNGSNSQPGNDRSDPQGKWPLEEMKTGKKPPKNREYIAFKDELSKSLVTIGTSRHVIIIGGAENADIKTPCSTPIQAMIQYTGGQWRIFNEFGKSVVKVNGREVGKEHGTVLCEGDRIAVDGISILTVTACQSRQKKWKSGKELRWVVAAVLATLLVVGILGSNPRGVRETRTLISKIEGNPNPYEDIIIAEEYYNNLEEKLQRKVKNADTLKEALTNLDMYRTIYLIENIGDVTYESGDAVDEAAWAYSQLTFKKRKIIDEEYNGAELSKAVELYQLLAADHDIRAAMESDDFGKGDKLAVYDKEKNMYYYDTNLIPSTIRATNPYEICGFVSRSPYDEWSVDWPNMRMSKIEKKSNEGIYEFLYRAVKYIQANKLPLRLENADKEKFEGDRLALSVERNGKYFYTYEDWLPLDMYAHTEEEVGYIVRCSAIETFTDSGVYQLTGYEEFNCERMTMSLINAKTGRTVKEKKIETSAPYVLFYDSNHPKEIHDQPITGWNKVEACRELCESAGIKWISDK